jgi:hypothetical protein
LDVDFNELDPFLVVLVKFQEASTSIPAVMREDFKEAMCKNSKKGEQEKTIQSEELNIER